MRLCVRSRYVMTAAIAIWTVLIVSRSHAQEADACKDLQEHLRWFAQAKNSSEFLAMPMPWLSPLLIQAIAAVEEPFPSIKYIQEDSCKARLSTPTKSVTFRVDTNKQLMWINHTEISFATWPTPSELLAKLAIKNTAAWWSPILLSEAIAQTAISNNSKTYQDMVTSFKNDPLKIVEFTLPQTAHSSISKPSDELKKCREAHQKNPIPLPSKSVKYESVLNQMSLTDHALNVRGSLRGKITKPNGFKIGFSMPFGETKRQESENEKPLWQISGCDVIMSTIGKGSEESRNWKHDKTSP